MSIEEAIKALSPPYSRVLDEEGVFVGVSRHALCMVLEHTEKLQKLDQLRLTMVDEVCLALDTAMRYGGIDGSHHKTWVIDQMVRALMGPKYADWVRAANFGRDGEGTYTWDEGIPP